jgi:acetylornithine/N-succinyldiaminopimelate aminotransferase
MLTNRQIFFQHIAQTSDKPMALEIERAEGMYLYDNTGKKYMDLISGISVSNLGHSHPKVVDAVKNQVEKYMHLMVYGEYIQSPQVKFAELLVSLLPQNLNSVYFVNSGSEANEGALKLAKKITRRSKIISFNKSYHGSTHGALSVMGDEYFRNAYRPLLPGVLRFDYGNETVLDYINDEVACVIMEPIQAESGVVIPNKEWIKKIRQKCDENCVLLIFDEVQTGFGRSGSLFAFQELGVSPDIITFAKSLGGGMPIGAFVSDKKMMWSFTNNPVLGHITTFGGHAVCAVAGYAALNVLIEENLISQIQKKHETFKKLLVHPEIKALNGKGLMMALVLKDEPFNKKVIEKCIEKGLIVDWFLYNDWSIRIAPPLIIQEEEIIWACNTILSSIDEVLKEDF